MASNQAERTRSVVLGMAEREAAACRQLVTKQKSIEMKMPKVESGGSFEKCPQGNHLAVCYEVIDMGTQTVTYQGETKKRHQIWIGWETPGELMEDGRPFVIGRRYTYSSHEMSRLRKDLESWRGQRFSDDDIHNFDIANVIGVGCFLNVVHTEREGKTYANIEAIAALPKGTETPSLHNPAVMYSLDEHDATLFSALSERMQETIRSCEEWPSVEGETADSSPF